MRAIVIAFALLLAFGPAAAQTVEGWEMRTPEGASSPCRAVKPQSSFNIQLMRSFGDQIVISVGGADLSQTPGSRIAVALSVDGAASVSLEGVVFGPVTFFRITDEMLAQALRNARTTTWRFPWGEASADVTGLGSAFDAITVCPE